MFTILKGKILRLFISEFVIFLPVLLHIMLIIDVSLLITRLVILTFGDEPLRV